MSAHTLSVLRLTPFFHHDGSESWPPEYDPIGGMQVQTLRTSRWMAERGVRQTVLTAGFPGLPRTRTLQPGLTVRICRGPTPRIPSETTGLFGLTTAWTTATLAECVRARDVDAPDLIHVHSDGQYGSLLVAQLASRILGVPYVLTLHSSRHGSYRPLSRIDQCQHRALQQLEALTVGGAALTTTLTHATARILRRATNVRAAAVLVVPDTIDVDRFSRSSTPIAIASFRSRHQLAPKSAVVTFCGRIAPEKGWEDFVSLAASMRDDDVSFLVVGDGPQRERMETSVRATGLRHRFRFTGFVDSRTVATALAASSVVLIPSRHEELGGVALEAMAVGTPVVAYAVGGLRHTVGHVTPELLAAPEDRHGLGARARIALATSERWRARIASARRWLAAEFHPDRVLPRLLTGYQAVVADQHLNGRRQPPTFGRAT